MAMIREEAGGVLLRNDHVAYGLRAAPDGVVEHLYWGPPIPDLAGLSALPRTAARSLAIEMGGSTGRRLGFLPQECPTSGRGDFREPCVEARHSGGALVHFAFVDLSIDGGAPDISPLPSARGEDGETLTLRLTDRSAGLALLLRYTIWPDTPCLARSAELINEGASACIVERLASFSIDAPPGNYEALHLGGSWAREMSVRRERVGYGRFTISSRRGTSSAVHTPFVALLEPEVTETGGRVRAATLMYSGDHQFALEKAEFDDVRIQGGLRPGFGWRLGPGESLRSPQALLLTVDGGLGAMSAAWHDFIRKRISPARPIARRPIYVNTWEAGYFDVDENKVVRLADQAKAIGAEMLVLDDGWFKGRCDDTRALGDWTPDPERFAGGIAGLASAIRTKGLKFGLWFEPEMVSPNSELFRRHPEWAIGAGANAPSLGRHQRTLNLALPEVVDHLEATIAAFLQSGAIDYVKWDMNREMTDIDAPGLPHRYMLGVYSLLRRLTDRFPAVVFENCASGGNRFDLGMLSFMHQTWTSDASDPIARLTIQAGATHLFPPSVLASYVGPSPNDQNGRDAPLAARIHAAAFCGSRGFSIGEQDLAGHAEELKRASALFLETEDDVTHGRFHRLFSGRNETAWQVTSADDERILIGYFRVLAEANPPFRQLRLRGLTPGAHYRLRDGEDVWSAEALMNAGLPMPHVDPSANPNGMAALPFGDFSSAILRLQRLAV